MSDSRSDSTTTRRLPFEIDRTHLLRFLLSLALATFLWGWVTQLTDPIITRRYQEMAISADGLDDTMIMVTTLPNATVVVRGPESEFDTLNRVDFRVSVDTSAVNGPGDYRLPVIVHGPDTSAEIRVEPELVPARIDELITQVLPLEVQNTLPEDDPRTVSEIVPDVSQVTVSGPSSAVDRVARVTLPVTLDQRNESFTDIFTPYAIDANDQRVSEVQILPGQVSTRVELESRGKVVSVIPVISGVPAEGFSVQQRAAFPETIVVDGPAEALDALLFVNTQPVDITGATANVSDFVGIADLPAGVTVVEPRSGEVEVRVALEDISSTSQTLSSVPVELANVPSGLSASFEPRSITISLDGPDAVLAQMGSSDVRVVVDLGGMDVGDYELRPQIVLPQGVTWTATDPEVIQVTLSASATPESSPVSPPTTPENDQLWQPVILPERRAR
jgi:YbbR domain-containing protein